MVPSNFRKSVSSIEKLNQEINKIKNGNNNQDDSTFWQLERDKAGNGYAVIRFLPTPKSDGEDGLPWVRYYDHGFQGPGGWYIELSRTSINQKDPVSEYNSELWNTGIEANKELARKQKRRLKYVSNIYVIQDPKNPDNEGKVFRFKYGKKIFEKITEAMNPTSEAEKAINPFDFWDGGNFKLKVRTVDRYPNYDMSSFQTQDQFLGGDEEKLNGVWKKEYSLQELIKPNLFKSYDELKTRLDKVLGKGQNRIISEEKQRQEDEADKAFPTGTITKEVAKEIAESPSIPEDTDGDADLNYFKSLAED